MMRLVSSLCFLLALTDQALPQQTPDFSGTYALGSLARSDSAGGANFREQTPGPKTTLNISQNANSIEARFTFASGKTATLKYHLDDSESKNVDPDGAYQRPRQAERKEPRNSIDHKNCLGRFERL